MTNRKPIRHGDVILLPVEHAPAGKALEHLTLAEGEATGHAHRITSGAAKLFQFDEKTYLSVQSEIATLSHEEHKALEIPHGDYEIKIQREYDDENEWRQVVD